MAVKKIMVMMLVVMAYCKIVRCLIAFSYTKSFYINNITRYDVVVAGITVLVAVIFTSTIIVLVAKRYCTRPQEGALIPF